MEVGGRAEGSRQSRAAKPGERVGGIKEKRGKGMKREGGGRGQAEGAHLRVGDRSSDMRTRDGVRGGDEERGDMMNERWGERREGRISRKW